MDYAEINDPALDLTAYRAVRPGLTRADFSLRSPIPFPAGRVREPHCNSLPSRAPLRQQGLPSSMLDLVAEYLYILHRCSCVGRCLSLLD